MGNGRGVPVGLEKGEVVVGNFEGLHGTDQRVGDFGGFRWGAADQSGTGGEVGWRANCVGDVDSLGRVVRAEKELAVVGVDLSLKVVQVGQSGEMIGGQAEGADLIIVELRVGEDGLEGMPEMLLGDVGLH